MDQATVVMIGAAITVIGGAVMALLWKVFSMGRRIGQMEGRLTTNELTANTTVGFLRRRGNAKAMSNGMINTIHLGTRRVTTEWRERFRPLLPALREWYRTEGRGLSENDQFVSLENALGDAIVAQICGPHGIDDGECLAMALLLCRETQVVNPTDRRIEPPGGEGKNS